MGLKWAELKSWKLINNGIHLSKREMYNLAVMHVWDNTGELFSFFFLSDLAKLRQKFEEDKQRIALMKTSRKFKPY